MRLRNCEIPVMSMSGVGVVIRDSVTGERVNVDSTADLWWFAQ